VVQRGGRIANKLLHVQDAGTHFTCFTGSLLALLVVQRGGRIANKLLHVQDAGTHFTCFTGTKAQILTQLEHHRRHSDGGRRARQRRALYRNNADRARYAEHK
jgi:hypothetical protein